MSNEVIAAMSPLEIQGMVDHASRQSDRWLFLVLLVVLVCCLAVGLVYQTKWVRALVDELRQDRKELGDIIKTNTGVLGRVERVLDK